MSKQIRDSTPEELGDSPMNLYLYAVTVLKGRLPLDQHSRMEALLREKPDEYVRGYFDFLSKRSLLGRILSAFGG